MVMKKVNVGVIGVGQLGQHHVRIYNELEDTNLVGICDTDPKKEEKAKVAVVNAANKSYN